MESKKNSVLGKGFSKKKRILLVALSSTLSVVALAGAAACVKKNADYGEDGVYYCVVDGQELSVTLKDGKATVWRNGEFGSGSYTVNKNNEIVFKINGEEGPMTAMLADGALQLTVDGATYTYYKKINHTVKFEANGGTAVNAATVLNGQTLAQPAAPEKEGYKFVAWYTDSEFTTTFAFDSQIITSDMMLYARYIDADVNQREYTVQFDSLGGMAVEPMTTISGKLFDLPVLPDRAAGQEFLGWWISDSQDATKLTCKYTDQTLNENQTLYAVWKSGAPAISVNEKGIEWTQTSATASYTLKITDPNGGVTTNPSSAANKYAYDFSSKQEGEYKIEVTVGDVTSTAYYTNKALARVSYFTVENPSVLVYNAVANATQYYVTVDCGDDAHVHTYLYNGSFTSFDFSNCEMQEGGIVFTVTATAPGYASSVSEEFVYVRNLDAVTGLAYDANANAITWNTVANAKYYEVTIACGDTVDTYIVGEERAMALSNAYMGDVTVSVVPVAQGYNAPAAATLTVAAGAIASPANVRQYAGNNGEKIAWNAVDGAASYVVKVGSETIETTETTIDAPASLLVDGSVYTISVQAIDANGEKSRWSTPVTVQYRALTEVNYSKGILSWNAVGGARSYGIIVNGDRENAITVAEGKTEYAVELTKAGKNVVTVCYYDFYYNELGAKDIELYANEISFVAQGADTAIAPMYKVIGDPIELPSPVREGRVFEGWYNVPGGPKNNGQEYTATVYTGTTNMTLFAYWTSLPQEINLVIADQNEGSFSATEGVYEQKMTLYYDSTYTLPVPVCNNQAKAFDGWFDADGNRLTDALGNSLSTWDGLEDATVYAHFENILAYTQVKSGDTVLGYSVKGVGAIYNVTELKIPASYTDPESGATYPVVEIAPNAFYYCDNLVKISIPDTVKDITIGAGGPTAATSSFQFCNNLKEIEVYCGDESSHSTHDVVFASDANGGLMKRTAEDADTYELYYIPQAKTGDYVIEDCVISLHENVFNQASVSRVFVPASVTAVGNGAFSNSKINEIEFLGSSVALGSKVFANSMRLTKVALPANTTYTTSDFDRGIFDNCTALENVVIDGATGAYMAMDGMLVTTDGTYTLVFCPAGKQGALVLPQRINKIAPNAFANCRKLESVTIKEYVTTIGEKAFANCVNLTNVSFTATEYDESKALTIDSNAFSGCANLTSIELPVSLKSLGADAFSGAKKLETVILNTTENATFENNAFSGANIKNVVLTASMNSVIADLNAVFNGCEVANFDVADGNGLYSSDAYGVLYNKAQDTLVYAPYKAYDATFAMPSTVTTIATKAFMNRTGLTSVTIPATVTMIEASAFANSGLTNLVFADRTSALEISTSAFSGCTGLTELNLVENVTKVSATAFANCTALTTVNLPATLTEISISSVFSGCSAINTFNVAAANTAITGKDGVIYAKDENGNAYSLQFVANMASDVTIPNTVSEIVANAFANKTGITKVTFQEGRADDLALTIGTGAFKNVPNLKQVTLPEGLSVIVTSMFEECISLETINVPASVTMIEDKAFYNCSSLKNVIFDGQDIPAEDRVPLEIGSVASAKTKNGTGTFQGCSSLKEIAFPERTTRIGAFAFCEVKSLERVVIPSTVQVIGGTYKNTSNKDVGQGQTFQKCTALKEVIFAANEDPTLESQLTTLHTYTFSETAIVNFTMPDSVTTFAGNQIFMRCESLKYIKVSDGITTFNQANLFNGCKALETVILPANLTSITQMGMFRDCVSLKNIVLPETLTSITGTTTFYNCASLETLDMSHVKTWSGTNAFYGCTSLASVIIPENWTSIPANMFTGCTNLTSITFAGNKVTSIGNQAFSGTGITSIEIPQSTSINFGTGVFQDCMNLKTVTINAPLAKAPTQLFQGCSALETVIINNNTAYEIDTEYGTVMSTSGGVLYALTPGTKFTNGIVELPSTITELANYALYGNTWIKELYIPASVTKIGNYAFGYCDNLEKLVFLTDEDGNYGIKTLGSNLFSENKVSDRSTAVKELYIPASVTSVGSNAFARSSYLTKVVWATSAAIPSNAFYDCSALVDVQITGAITTIGGSAFSSCVSLKTFVVPDTVKQFSAVTNASASVGGYNVNSNTGIFTGCSSLETVVLPAGMTGGIPTNTFQRCVSLKNINLPAGITAIGGSAFDGCESLTSIDLSHVVGIGSGSVSSAFKGTGLTSVHIPSTLTLIGPSTFASCVNLKTVTGGENVQAIYDSAFSGCTALTSVSFPKSTTLHTGMFQGCTSLVSVSMPMVNAVHAAGSTDNNAMFKDCVSLETVILGNITKIPKETFANCESLTNFVVPATVTSIADSAFYNAGLTNVVLPQNLTTIGSLAFYGNNFETVEIPAAVSSIGIGAFANCKSLTGFVVDAGNTYYKTSVAASAGNKAFADVLYDVYDKLVCYPAAKESTGNILDLTGTGITFGEFAFTGLQNYTAVILPEEMTEIPAYAFAESNIRAMEIKSNITAIGGYAFYNCKLLANLAIADSVTEIGKAYTDASTKTVYGGHAFQGCVSLTEIYLPANLTEIMDYTFANTSLTSIELPASVTEIGEYAFVNSKLTSFVLPENVTKIGRFAFYNCSELAELTLHEHITKLDTRAFSMTAIKTITIYGTPEGASASGNEMGSLKPGLPGMTPGAGTAGDSLINGHAFAENLALEEIIFLGQPDWLTKGDFAGCTSLKKVTFSAGWTGINASMFKDCTSLEEFIIPETVTSLAENAFAGCTAMKEITIPASVVSFVGVSASPFEGWTADQTIYVAYTEEQATALYGEGWYCGATVVYANA